MDVTCKACGHVNAFAQPYPYHAGHANQGFLYNDDGNRTLVWSSFDPAWEALAGRLHPWTLGPESWARIEAVLAPAPGGGRWRAVNPPRCAGCSQPLGAPIGSGGISYLEYPGSVVLDDGPAARSFQECLSDHTPTA
jgi:hypothetical protein